MLLFGHMGIGSKLVNPWTRELPKAALLLGTVLPDLIDKPIYYALSLATGNHGADLGLVSSTRTFGHTAIFLIIITVIATLRRSKAWAALALGVATHLILDNLSDSLAGYFQPEGQSIESQSSALIAMLWPFYQRSFAVAPFKSMGDHLTRTINPLTLGAEVVGAAILAWDAWKNRHESEILQMLALRRHRNKLFKRHKRALD